MKCAVLIACLAVAFCYSDKEIIRDAKLTLLGKYNIDVPAGEQPRIASDKEFEDFVKRYQKTYATAEEKDKRRSIYKINMIIADYLTQHDQGTAKYGETKFADLLQSEFSKFYLGYRPDINSASILEQRAVVPDIEAPASFDWRKKGAVTPVKDQGQCGSCWAFSATENIEGQWFLAKGQLISLAEAELVDCDHVDSGCNGGLMKQAYKQVMKLGGMEAEKDYHYQPRDAPCRFDKSKVVAYINGSKALPTNEKQLASILATNGPIANAINADNMQLYKSGIAHPKRRNCDPQGLDHGVLIVGYGTEKNTPFWIIKNSWGTGWGEQGYYRVFRGGGVCGLNRQCSTSMVAK